MNKAVAKPGDLIWVSDTVSDIPDQSYAPGCVMTQEEGQNECMVAADAWMPHHPALPAVAALLTEPGLAAALKKILSLTEVPWADEDGWIAKDLVKRFVSAIEEGESRANGDMLEVG